MMTLEDLEEALEEILPNGFEIDIDSNGQIIIHTGLTQDEDGDLVEFKGDEDEEDPDYDPDFQPLEEEDDDD
jgi:hypothetical protein